MQLDGMALFSIGSRNMACSRLSTAARQGKETDATFTAFCNEPFNVYSLVDVEIRLLLCN